MKRLVLGWVLLLPLASCHPCDRDPRVWVPGRIAVNFNQGVTDAEAKGVVARLRYVYLQGSFGYVTVEVPVGQECRAEELLREQPEVRSAWQDSYGVVVN